MILDYTNKKQVSYSQKRQFYFFFFKNERKCIGKNVGWNISNDNNACDSHLEETEYTGNKWMGI